MTSAAKLRYAKPHEPRRIGLGGPNFSLVRDTVSVGENPKMLFHRKQTVVISQEAEGFCCEISSLGMKRCASTRPGASQAVATALFEETAKLLSTLTHELDAEQRARKRLLLGSVDILPSGLVQNVPRYAWVLGTIVGSSGHPQFVGVGSRAERYEFAKDFERPIPGDSYVRMAKVHAGPIGEPIGPVVELERPLGIDPDATWATWERKLEGHE